MAYKIQIGKANLSGSITVPGDIDASLTQFDEASITLNSSSNQITVPNGARLVEGMSVSKVGGSGGIAAGTTVSSVSGNTVTLSANPTGNGTATLRFTGDYGVSAGSVSSDNKIIVTGSAQGSTVKVSTADALITTSAILYNGADLDNLTSTKRIEFSVASGDPTIKLYDRDAGEGISMVPSGSGKGMVIKIGENIGAANPSVILDGESGKIQSEQFKISGSMVAYGNVTLTNCKLQVEGSTTNIATGSITIKDKFLSLNSSSADVDIETGNVDAGFTFGADKRSTAATNAGGFFVWDRVGNRFSARNAVNKTQMTNVSASHYFGDGDNLEKNMFVGNSSNAVIDITSNATINHGTNLGLLHVVSGTSAIEVTLPTVAQVGDGNFIRIKNVGSGDLKIKTQSNQTIDGVNRATAGNELVLSDPFIALDIACDNTEFFIL